MPPEEEVVTPDPLFATERRSMSNSRWFPAYKVSYLIRPSVAKETPATTTESVAVRDGPARSGGIFFFKSSFDFVLFCLFR